MAKPTTFLFLLFSSILLLLPILEAHMGGSFPGEGFGFPPDLRDPEYGFGKPGWSGAYGGGYGGPSGSRTWSGVRRGWTVCKERGRCHKRKLRCPRRCYHKWSKAGKHYGAGGGEGGCTLDCRKCVSYC